MCFKAVRQKRAAFFIIEEDLSHRTADWKSGGS